MDRIIVGVLMGTSNIAAAVLSIEKQDFTPTAIVAGFTAISGALFASIKILSPVIADAIRSIGPALAEIQKQREEIFRGSLAAQIERLQQAVDQGNQRVEAANQKLHDARDAANATGILHAAEIQTLKADVESGRAEIASLRAENLDLTREMGKLIREIAARAQANAESIDFLSKSAEFVSSHPHPEDPNTQADQDILPKAPST